MPSLFLSLSDYLRNMASMRRVTAKPPNMLMGREHQGRKGQPQDQPVRPSVRLRPASGGAICTSAPMAMMLEMALVTLISGVCSAGVTFHTTM